MFIASLEQMRRYGVPQEDIAAALAFARRIMAFDAAVFPDAPCALQMFRTGGPIQCARYVTMPGAGESYILYVELLEERLRFQALALMTEHAHRGGTDEGTARRLVTDAIALHEVRHRLQEHRGASLGLWKVDDIAPDDAAVIRQVLTELAPDARTEREVDARIVEFLYVRDRIEGRDDPAAAARRVPR
jgi:hypothetical protein